MLHYVLALFSVTSRHRSVYGAVCTNVLESKVSRKIPVGPDYIIRDVMFSYR